MITLFHNPSSQASIRAHTILKQAAGQAQATATIDQASSHASQSKLERTEFELGACPEVPRREHERGRRCHGSRVRGGKR